MPYFDVPDARIYFEQHGSGEPLVLIHGFFWSGEAWAKLIPRIAERYRVIVPDLRGHGRSGGEPETLHHDHFAHDLLALLDHLDLDRAHFVGHSSGGMSLIHLGLIAPERARTLTLVSATYRYDERAMAEMVRVVEEMPERPRVIERARHLHGPWHGDDYWRILGEVFRSYTVGVPELHFQPSDLARIDRPVLILHGDRDRFFPVDVPLAMYAAFPDAELAIVPACGHFLPKEQPELFLAILTDFLARRA